MRAALCCACGERCGVWSVVGLGMALCMAAIAWRRSRVAGGFYDADVYAMTNHSHRVYAAVFFGFSFVFFFAIARGLQSLGVGALAVLALGAVFYGTSFLRGASDTDE